MSTKKSRAAITFAEAFEQLATEGREGKILYDQACAHTTDTPTSLPSEAGEGQTREAMDMAEVEKPRRKSLLDKIKAHNPIGEEREQRSREILERLTTSAQDTLTGHPHRTPKQDAQFPLDRFDRCKIYLSGVFEGLDTWPNLVEHGLTEKHLEEALEVREANRIHWVTFREDMSILEHAFADPEWVRATVKKSAIGLIKASIANGTLTPRPGYESPVRARLRAVRAQLEELEKTAKEQEELDFELWQRQLSDDDRRAILDTYKLEQERIWLRAEFTKRRKADGR